MHPQLCSDRLATVQVMWSISHLRPPRLLAIALSLGPAPLLLPAGLLCLLLNHCSPCLPLCSVSLFQRSPVSLQYQPVADSMALLCTLYIHTRAACKRTAENARGGTCKVGAVNTSATRREVRSNGIARSTYVEGDCSDM